MAKAFQFYQTSVCRREATDLDEIRETLAEFVRRHSGSQPQAEGVIDVAGKIDPNEPEPIQNFAGVCGCWVASTQWKTTPSGCSSIPIRWRSWNGRGSDSVGGSSELPVSDGNAARGQ